MTELLDIQLQPLESVELMLLEVLEERRYERVQKVVW